VIRAYCDGKATKEYLAMKLDEGLVCTDYIHNGHSGGDVLYFREGTPEEIADCRARLNKANKVTP
jgi:hypothetical protein